MLKNRPRYTAYGFKEIYYMHKYFVMFMFLLNVLIYPKFRDFILTEELILMRIFSFLDRHHARLLLR